MLDSAADTMPEFASRTGVAQDGGSGIQGGEVVSHLPLAAEAREVASCAHCRPARGQGLDDVVRVGVPGRGRPGRGIERRKTISSLTSDGSKVTSCIDDASVHGQGPILDGSSSFNATVWP